MAGTLASIPTASQPDLRSLLESLPNKARLFDVARHFGVAVPQKGTKTELSSLLAGSQQLGLRSLVEWMHRDELRLACQRRGLSADSRARSELEARVRLMIDANHGLAKTYTAPKEPIKDDSRVIELRRLHEEADRAVLDAYGWADIEVPPYCSKTDAEHAAVKAFEDEVIDRLFALNAERAAQELAASNDQSKSAATSKPKNAAQSEPKRATTAVKQKSKKPTPQGQGSLF